MRNATKSAVLLNAALLLTGIANAQTTPRATSAPNQQTTPASQPTSSSNEDEMTNAAPVFWITSVEVIRSTHAPMLDVVRVRGLVPTEGWEAVEVVPITKGTPTDGTLDLMLVAEPPSDNTTPASYSEVEAIFTIEPGHPFSGIRVHGAANRVVLEALPGYAEAAAPPKACIDCAGKLFVPKGQTAPAGRSQASIVREEELPSKLRVIRESDGVGKLDSDPNRVTLLLNEKNEIIAAMWD